MSAAGPKQYLFIDAVGTTNIINIPILHIQPNQDPLVLVVLGKKYKNRTYIRLHQKIIVSKTITIIPSVSALALNYQKHAVEVGNIHLLEGTASSDNPQTLASCFYVQVEIQGGILTLVSIPVLLPIPPLQRHPNQVLNKYNLT